MANDKIPTVHNFNMDINGDLITLWHMNSMMMVINTMRHLDCPVNYCSDWNEIQMRAYNREERGWIW
jgi:hypothetical protein